MKFLLLLVFYLFWSETSAGMTERDITFFLSETLIETGQLLQQQQQ